jgi:hypothetical protein
MLVRPFVSCVFLFFAVALLACNLSYKQAKQQQRTELYPLQGGALSEMR